MNEKRGLSPLMAVTMLLALTVMVFAVYVTEFIRSHPPSSPIRATLKVEREDNTITITHLRGNEIGYAFKLNGGAVLWLNLVVRKNGENLNITGGARVGELTDGVINFGAGSKLELPVGVESGDEVSVVYVPTGQVLVEKKF